jgi:hypothetical protein
MILCHHRLVGRPTDPRMPIHGPGMINGILVVRVVVRPVISSLYQRGRQMIKPGHPNRR